MKPKHGFVSHFSFYCIYGKFTLGSATAATMLQIIYSLVSNPMSVSQDEDVNLEIELTALYIR